MKIFTQHERMLAGFLAFGLIIGYIVKYFKGEISTEQSEIVKTGVDSTIVNFYSQLNDKKNETEFSKHSKIESIGLVNINTAQETRLKSLPGIGPQLAKRIINKRNEIGRFNTIEELTQVKGIGKKMLVKLQPHISTGGNIE